MQATKSDAQKLDKRLRRLRTLIGAAAELAAAAEEEHSCEEDTGTKALLRLAGEELGQVRALVGRLVGPAKAGKAAKPKP
jgi:hypothetical protein